MRGEVVVWGWDGIIVPGMALAWPLRASPDEVVPVEVDAWTVEFHLVQRCPVAETLADANGPEDVWSVRPDLWLGDHDQLRRAGPAGPVAE